MRIEGYIYQPRSSDRQACQLYWQEGQLFVMSVDGSISPAFIETVDDSATGLPQRITLTDQRTFIPSALIAPEFFPEESPWRKQPFTAKVFTWARNASGLKFAALIIIFVALIPLVRWSIPYIADEVTRFVPSALERQIGKIALQQFDKLIFDPTNLPETRQEHIRVISTQLIASIGGHFPKPPEITFRSMGAFPANAFAFPSGPLVLSDSLVDLLETDEMIRAVIAHELGHIQGRHTVRQLLRASGLVLMATLVLGTDSEGMEELATLAVTAQGSSWSRKFETESDNFAGWLLQKSGYAPEHLASALEMLSKNCGEGCEGGGWLSSHPDFEARIKSLRSGVMFSVVDPR